MVWAFKGFDSVTKVRLRWCKLPSYTENDAMGCLATPRNFLKTMQGFKL